MPGGAQKYIAKKLGDDPHHYTMSSAISELGMFAGTTFSVTYLLPFEQTIYLWPITMIVGMFSTFAKTAAFLKSNKEQRPVFGSLYLTIPMYLAIGSFYAAKAVGNFVGNHYRGVYKELESKKEKLRIENSTKNEQQPEITLTPDGEKFEYPEELVEETEEEKKKFIV